MRYMPNRDRMLAAVRSALLRRGLNPRPTAEAAGISHSTLANFLNGDTKLLSTGTLDRLATHLHLPIGVLVGTQKDPLEIEEALAEEHPIGVPNSPIHTADEDIDVQSEQLILQRLANLEAGQDRLAAAIEALTQALMESPKKTGTK